MHTIKVIDFQRYGGPFLHRELGLIRRKEGENTIFIINNNYPYTSAIEFLAKDFTVLRIYPWMISALKKLRITTPEIDVDTAVDYSRHLGSHHRKNKAIDSARKLDIILTLRPKNDGAAQSNNQSYERSARDYDWKDIQFIERFLLKDSRRFLIAGEDRSKSTVEEISSCNAFFGTNSGPYVCAMSLGKPAFLINIIPFLGTNCYHKINDLCLPLPIKKRGSLQPLSIQAVIDSKLTNLTEQQIIERGYSYGGIPEEVLIESLKEFFAGPANPDAQWKPSDEQVKQKLLIEKYCDVANGPTFPNAYINYLNKNW